MLASIRRRQESAANLAASRKSISAAASTMSAGQPQSSQNRLTRKASSQQAHISQKAGLFASEAAPGRVAKRNATSAPKMMTARIAPSNGSSSEASVKLDWCLPRPCKAVRTALSR